MAWWSAVALVAALAGPAFGGVTGTVRVSVRSNGTQAKKDSFAPSVSSDGRFVAFDTKSGLVPADTNGASDVFVRALDTKRTNRVSVGPGGRQGSGGSFDAAISSDGRFVAFDSEATNLVRHDVNRASDIFIRDRSKGITRRVSVSSPGHQADADSYEPAISGDGRFVAYTSYASNLVPYDVNRHSDVFVRDRRQGTTHRVSLSTSDHQGNGACFDAAISENGRFVAFDSLSSNLVWADTNGVGDVFVRDRQLGKTVRASVNSRGVQGNHASVTPTLSRDGHLVAFTSYASNLVPNDSNRAPDVFVRDLSTRRTVRVSVSTAGHQGNGGSFNPILSAGGRYVMFQSFATNLVTADTNGAADVFLHDLVTGTTTRVSVGSGGSQAGGPSFRPSISGDGTVAAFESDAPLVFADTNQARDVYARNPLS